LSQSWRRFASLRVDSGSRSTRTTESARTYTVRYNLSLADTIDVELRDGVAAITRVDKSGHRTLRIDKAEPQPSQPSP
jgi:hypothetical protein